jgi:hypothetical protein
VARKPAQTQLDDEFASPSPAEADDTPKSIRQEKTSPEGETAGSSPRTNPRTLARTPTSKKSTAKAREQHRKDRIRKRLKSPRSDKDQLNGRVPIFIIYAVRDWCHDRGITEIGEGITELLEDALTDRAPEFLEGAYVDYCLEKGHFSTADEALRRYRNGDG